MKRNKNEKGKEKGKRRQREPDNKGGIKDQVIHRSNRNSPWAVGYADVHSISSNPFNPASDLYRPKAAKGSRMGWVGLLNATDGR